MNYLNKTSETLLAEITFENKIREELPEVTIYFDYQEVESDTILSLITISKEHGERFLFHKIKSHSKSNCLYEMLTFIKSDYKKNLETYEIIWRKKNDIKDQKSWFCGRSFLEIIDKFYYSKDTSEIIIYKIELKPIS